MDGLVGDLHAFFSRWQLGLKIANWAQGAYRWVSLENISTTTAAIQNSLGSCQQEILESRHSLKNFYKVSTFPKHGCRFEMLFKLLNGF